MDTRKPILWVIFLNFFYFIIEFYFAYKIGSASLFADSIDFLEDTAINTIIFFSANWSLKNRLRRDVMDTLTYLNLRNEIDLSRTERDLVMIRDKIRTEIRFAGLENDRLLPLMIRHKFGISLQNI